jgi:hypothetical protein
VILKTNRSEKSMVKLRHRQQTLAELVSKPSYVIMASPGGVYAQGHHETVRRILAIRNWRGYPPTNTAPAERATARV